MILNAKPMCISLSSLPLKWIGFLPATATAGTSTANCRTTSGQTNTPAANVAAAEHGRVSKHVGDDEEADVGSSDVDLVEMGDAAVAGGDGDVLELDVHVVLGCSLAIVSFSSAFMY